MMSSNRIQTVSDAQEMTPQEIFQQQWRIYRTLVDNNYLHHREALECLRQILLDEAPPSFRFLDIACGDGVEIVGVLRDTPIGRYHGVDLSRMALDQAEVNLAALECPVLLEQRDFVDAVTVDPEPADIVWIGQSLHHLQQRKKLEVMRVIRGIVGDRGLLIVYEPSTPEGEERSDWLQHWDAQRTLWNAYTQAEWETMSAHVHAADFPEPTDQWHALGRAAGFATTNEVFVAPSDLFRMYRFGPQVPGHSD
jgi:SAM-dependent methyltransferase